MSEQRAEYPASGMTGASQTVAPWPSGQHAPPRDEEQDRRGDPVRQSLLDVRHEVAKAVVGQDSTVTGMLIALLSRGHVLLEGVPGVAKQNNKKKRLG